MTEFKKFTLASSYYSRGKLIEVSDGGIFQIYPTKKKINANTISFDGVYPYVARGEGSNGIRGYINYEEEYLNPANTISFGQDTGTMYFQDRDYFTGDKIQIFKLNPKLNKKMNYRIALYLIATLRKIFATYTWGQTSFALDKISYIEIELPINSKTNELDFKYMEDRVKALEQDQVKTLEHYLTVTGLDDYELTDSDKKVLSYKPEFSEFKIEDIFEIHKGKRLTKANQIKGDTLFIGSTALNHGETARIGQKPIFKANTITVCYNGSVGETFYQDVPYWASDDINVLTLRDFKLNAEVAEYLCTVLKKAGSKYGYTYKWNVSRMKKSIISLPVTANKVVDFQYMENYIKAVQKLTIKNVVKYKDEVIAKKKEIIN